MTSAMLTPERVLEPLKLEDLLKVPQCATDIVVSIEGRLLAVKVGEACKNKTKRSGLF